MKRWSSRLLLLACALSAAAAQLSAAPPSRRAHREKVQYPPRYTRASMSWNYVFRDKNGQVHVRKVYPGYANQFPPPAYLYYGYPHSGDDTGLGF